MLIISLVDLIVSGLEVYVVNNLQWMYQI